MALKVVGTGFGRTGTNSLKLALEQLGFGPCHHMFEIRDNPDQLPFWQAAARGEFPDWDEVFANYAACVDWPAARFWREISAHYPDAKVLHSVRSEDSWIKSVHATIYPAMRDRTELEPGAVRDRLGMAYEIVVAQTFDGRLDDRDHALAVFRAHTEDVRREIPSDRLLIYDVAEGWKPLCRFLGVAVPDSPFPRANTAAAFHQRRTGPVGRS
jgi:hypothetical protein